MKPQSEAIQRIVKLQSGIKKTDNGSLVPMISPKIEGRIKDITEVDDFGSYTFLRDNEISVNNPAAQQAMQM